MLDPLLADGELLPPEPNAATPVPDCYETTIEPARRIEAALLEVGIARRVSHGVSFVLRDGNGPEIELRILPLTPDGDIICDCG